MILLINPKTTKPSEFQSDYFREPNLGLLYLTSILDQNHFDVDLLDLEQYYNYTSEQIELILKTVSSKYFIFGITCLTNTYGYSLKIAQSIKKANRNAIIIFGGPHVSFFYNNILMSEDIIDFICIGESEDSFLSLVQLLITVGNKNRLINNFASQLNKIKGIAYKNSQGKIFNTGYPDAVILDDLPLPARYKLSNINYYYKVANVIINRGCPNECSFCSRQRFFKKVRIRSIDSVFSEIRDILTLQNYDYINFYDNININRTFFLKFCNMFIRNKIKIPWGCELRVDSIEQDDAKLLKEAGCQLIATGIESASKKVLKKNFKYQDPARVLEGLKALKLYDIPIQCYFVLGLPGETESTFQKTVKYIKDLPLTQEDKLEFFAATPYPGSLLWEKQDEYQIKIIEKNFDNYDCQHIIFETQDLNIKQLQKMFKIAKKLESFVFEK